MACRKLLQCTWIVATLVAASSAASNVHVERLDVAGRKLERRDIIKQQLPLSDGRVSPSGAAARSKSGSFRVKYNTFDGYWLGEEANVTFEGDEFLTYSHFGLLDAQVAVEKGFLNVADLDCAASKPNALYGGPKTLVSPSVIRSNATALAEQGYSEFFDVIAFSLKPIGPAPQYIRAFIDAWKISGKDVELVSGMMMLWFSEEFHAPLTANPSDWGWEGWGEGVNWIEIESRTEEGELWDFCLDNLLLVFYPRDDE